MTETNSTAPAGKHKVNKAPAEQGRRVLESCDASAHDSSAGSAKRNVRRSRSIRFHVTATEEEATLIRQRMAETGLTNMGAYARKMMINGLHITLDLSDVQEMCRLLRRIGLNVNQLAKRANETGSIYAADLEELRQRYDEIWDAARKILEGLARVK